MATIKVSVVEIDGIELEYPTERVLQVNDVIVPPGVAGLSSPAYLDTVLSSIAASAGFNEDKILLNHRGEPLSSYKFNILRGA